MTTEAILFDAAGTLIKPKKSVGESYATIAARYGMRVTASELLARFRICFDRAAPLAFPGAEPESLCALERAWWERLVRQVFEPFGFFGEFDAYFNELFSYFARPDSWQLYPEVIQTLQALRERELTTFVVSNFDSRLCDILAGLDVSRWLDGVVISSAVGYAKPDRRIFDFVLKSRHLAAQEVLHVGDSLVNDIGGAANAGVRGILVDREAAQRADTIARVANLLDIVNYLE
jgi:putative hydrolase of the HAD superfamily